MIGFWQPVTERYGLRLDLVNSDIDPTFAFMTLDHDSKIRMDCSSPSAMARQIGPAERFVGPEHLAHLQREAHALFAAVFEAAGV